MISSGRQPQTILLRVELFYFNSSDVLGLDLTLQWGGLLKNRRYYYSDRIP